MATHSHISGSPAYRIVSIALLTAVTAVFTLLVRVPIAPTRGYINLGDVAIFFTAFTFGPLTALVSGGLGTAIADLLAGYPQWAPITLVIHGLQGFLAGFIIKHMLHRGAGRVSRSMRQGASGEGSEDMEASSRSIARSLSVLAAFLAGVVGTIIMTGLYFLAAGVMYGFGPAAVEIPGNLIQCATGVIGGFFLAKTVVRAYPPVRDFFL